MTARPRVVLGTNIMQTTDQAIAALAEQGIVRERGHQLVEVVMDHREPIAGETSAPARAVPVTLNRLVELCERSAEWVELRLSKDEDGEEVWVDVPVKPPANSVSTIMDRQHWEIPALRGLTETPFVRLDGTMAATPGYDPATGYHLAIPRGLTVSVPDGVNHDDADAAYHRLLTTLADFPFEAPHHAASAVAALLTLVARPAIRGPCPMFIVTSSTPGSGKSLLVDVLHAIAIGRELHRTAYPDGEDEQEKRITSILMAGYAAACFDNVSGSFGGPAMDALLTSSFWMGRELGKSRMISVPARTILFATGNNIRLRGDMARRVVPIRIEPQMERPEDRTGFAIPKIIRWVNAHRSALLSDALIILRAYCLAGMPSPPPGFGSFEDWNALVRGSLLYAGAADPYLAAQAWADEADEKREQYIALAAAWYNIIGAKPILLSEVPHVADGTGREPLREALRTVAGQKGEISVALLGNKLKREKGRRFGPYRFDSPPEKVHGARLWQVVRDAAPVEEGRQ